ncbi:uncharacterized protein LTR77_010277 [Saxophila tyrrhenica]|uniref:Metallo-beta-lactamase domain-containing protein n=1 Tax=Saxophila tyrrhenica TaxID=1690608 RepID=A0AAV9NXB7_9PEZI|nr:hypothetical protein LTR77_010277 [Saxophila tyrrhenica]
MSKTTVLCHEGEYIGDVETGCLHVASIMEPIVHHIHEPVTGTWQYIVCDPQSKVSVIIDAVLDYSKDSGMIRTASADQLLEVVTSNDYIVSHILETHAHADHLTASRYLQEVLAARQPAHRPLLCIGNGISQVQATMGGIYNIQAREMQDSFNHTFSDGEEFSIGNLKATIMHLPGHTPDHIGYLIGSNVFAGDSIFNADVGSGRCDFPGGDAVALYRSTQKLLQLPGHYKIYTGHDYPPKDRCGPDGKETGAVPYTTVEVQSRENKHVKTGTTMEEFVRWRRERDSTLLEPKLLRQAMHVNVRGGRLPAGPVEGFLIEQKPAGVRTAAA